MECPNALAKQVLSQLSYTPTFGVTFILKHFRARRNPFLRFFVISVPKLYQNPHKQGLRSPCQDLCKWRNLGAKSQWRRDFFSGKAFLSMEMGALATRTPKC